MNKTENTNCEQLLVAALDAISHRLETYCWNHNQPLINNPFENTGVKWSNDVFSVAAYDWNEILMSPKGDDTPEPNFRWRNLSVWWYKYLGRGMEWSLNDGFPLTPEIINEMLNECLASMPL